MLLLILPQEEDDGVPVEQLRYAVTSVASSDCGAVCVNVGSGVREHSSTALHLGSAEKMLLCVMDDT